GSALSGSGNSATSTFTTSTLSAGTHASIHAVYTATGSFVSSTSANLTPTLTVNQAPLTITASNQTKTYGFGGSSASLGPTAFTSSGLQNGETIGSVTLTTNDTTSGSGNYKAGSFTITPSAATGGTFTASNYNITYANAPTGLTVNARSLTVTATGV